MLARRWGGTIFFSIRNQIHCVCFVRVKALYALRCVRFMHRDVHGILRRMRLGTWMNGGWDRGWGRGENDRENGENKEVDTQTENENMDKSASFVRSWVADIVFSGWLSFAFVVPVDISSFLYFSYLPTPLVVQLIAFHTSSPYPLLTSFRAPPMLPYFPHVLLTWTPSNLLIAGHQLLFESHQIWLRLRLVNH